MKRVILAMGLVATLGGCYAVWSGFSSLNREAVVATMAQAERNEALDPLRRLLTDAVRLDPQTATPPAPGTKVILTGELLAGSDVGDPELGLSRPGALVLERRVTRFEAQRRPVERRVRIPDTHANRHYIDRYRTVKETKVETSWQPVSKPTTDFPLVTRRFHAPVKAGTWPMSQALVDRIEGVTGVELSETSRLTVAKVSKRRVHLDKGSLLVGDTVRSAIGDYKVSATEIPAGTYTILAVWDGQALGVWSDPSDGTELAIVRPGGFDDLVPPQLRSEMQPLTWTQRLEARRDLAMQMAGGGLLILFGLPAVALSRFRS